VLSAAEPQTIGQGRSRKRRVAAVICGRAGRPWLPGATHEGRRRARLEPGAGR